MNLIISSEERFFRTPDGIVWSIGGQSRAYSLWAKYLEVFDQVKILARVQDVDGNVVSPDIQRADGEGVSFHKVPYYVGPLQYIRRATSIHEALINGVGSEDALIARVPSQLANVLLPFFVRVGRPYGVEVVGDPHDVFAPGSVRHPLRPLFRWWFSRQLRQQCYGACAASYVTAQALQKRYPPHPKAFSNHVSDVLLEPPAFVSLSRVPDPHRHRFSLIFVGTLNQLYKAPDVLIDAITQCVKQGYDLEAVFVGDGQHRQELEARTHTRGIAERVHFRGWLPAGEAVRNELDKADLFVLPSRQEGLPRAMVEAMARGLPCIGSTVGGIPELLLPEDMVPPGDVGALATRICEVLGSPERMERMATRNLEKAQEYRSDLLHERRIQFYRYVRGRTEARKKHS